MIGSRLSAVFTRLEASSPSASSILAFARRHWLFLSLLLIGATLRVVTFLAYRPVIFGPDSYWYLEHARNLGPAGVRPIGFSAFLRALQVDRGLAVIPVAQHLLGLLTAVLIYAVLARLGVRRWLAALATAPLLLDAYQLNTEQQILSEPLFTAFLAAAAALLLWRRPLRPIEAALAGALLAAATLTRPIGLLAIVPAAITVLVTRARPSRLLVLGALLAAFALPVASYAAWFHRAHGEYALSRFEGRFLYGRVARFADCSEFAVPVAERPLCPRHDLAEQPSIAQLLWSKSRSPLQRVDPPPGLSPDDVAANFSRRAIRHQPFDYARTVVTDFAVTFRPTKSARPGDFGVDQWRFQKTYPIYRVGSVCPAPAETDPSTGCARKRERAFAILLAHGDRPAVSETLVSFLRGYQRVAFTPGPLHALAFVVALLTVAGIAGAGRSGLRAPTFLFAGTGLALSLGSVALTVFSWRYQMPLLVLLPPALALGLTALTGGRATDVEQAQTDRDAPAAAAVAADEPTLGGDTAEGSARGSRPEIG